MEISSGSPHVVIGVIDGPVYLDHPSFKDSRIRAIDETQLARCKSSNSVACMHGTLVTGILSGKRGSDKESAPIGICPGCELIICPIFEEVPSNYKERPRMFYPTSTPEGLAAAIIQTINAGARIINMSLGLSSSFSSLKLYRPLEEAYAYALQKEVILVVAAGNQGTIGSNTALFEHPWIVPVAACDEQGMLAPGSNYGPSIGNRGIMAPGTNIISTSPDGFYAKRSGTSIATPFVTGTVALLMSIFPDATSEKIIQSITTRYLHHRKSIVPSLLDAEAALASLKGSLRKS